MAKTVSYINTTPRTGKPGTSTSASVPRPSYTPIVGGGGTNIKEVINKLLPIIGENYADAVTHLYRDSLLQNPGFANNGESWVLYALSSASLGAYITQADDKNLLILHNGAAMQGNSLILKPETWYRYTYNPEPTPDPEIETELGGTASDFDVIDFTISYKYIDWSTVQPPTITTEKELTYSTVYFNLSFICQESGVFTVGFQGFDDTSEGSFKQSNIDVSSSESVQTISLQGIWDGTGDFVFSFTGVMEVRAIYLSYKPLQEHIAESRSLFGQIDDNMGAIKNTLLQLLQRVTLIQDEINNLYFNDLFLGGDLRAIPGEILGVKTLAEDNSRAIVNVASDVANNVKPAVSTLQNNISELSNTVSSLSVSLTSVIEDISDLQDRISALEGTGTE